jgi:hypothetical protein
LQAKLLDAARRMKSDGWWLTAEEYPGREKTMRARLMREMLGSLVQVPKPLKSFYMEVMQRKEDDHHASHSNGVNQFFHLLSSSVFIYCYILAFSNGYSDQFGHSLQSIAAPAPKHSGRGAIGAKRRWDFCLNLERQYFASLLVWFNSV